MTPTDFEDASQTNNRLLDNLMRKDNRGASNSNEAGAPSRSQRFAQLLNKVDQNIQEGRRMASSNGGNPNAGFADKASVQKGQAESNLPPQPSKYQRRVDKILQRLNDMQVDIENDKQGKLLHLDQQMSQTDATLNSWQEQNLVKF
mmetsp:Transcript_13361/g.22723  ORF Transcript_13361/g.22723 Transcript_13361/m.22723 type:complete len:146 (+) Transcript_13361:81-518(+)